MEQILKCYVFKVYPSLEIFGDNIFSMICFSLRLEPLQIAHLISMGTKFRLEYNGIERNSIFRENMEQDIKNGLLHIEDCTFLPVGDDMSPQIVDESTIPKTNSEEIWLERLNYLPVALEKLKSEYPHYYKIVNDYYFSDKKITLSDLAEKYHVSYQALSETLRRARRKLKIYIIMHEKCK